ncbi:hypothetical protein ACFT9M_06190 [Micromonospora purpureochromogenes]|uniref:hypothetical protein n=1 Tax=Micromonospora purpureochromogenes TaxID=47872 RepID=UPI00363854D5
MLRDLDLADAPVTSVEAAWVKAALSGEPAVRARTAIARGLRLLPPQLLLVAIKEALRYCSPGPAQDNLTGSGTVVQAVLSIADEVGEEVREEGPLWGGVVASLASEIIANQHFNAMAYPAPLIARTQAVWREGWPKSISGKLQSRAGGSPADLFAEATRCDLDAFLGVATHLWVQAQQHRFLRFPPDFFQRIGVAPAAVDLFLQATSMTLAELQHEVAPEPGPAQTPWDFNVLRRHPIVRLPDGSTQVIRIGFVLQRAFGHVTEFDVRDYLRSLDGGTDETVQGGREEAFCACLNAQFEHNVGEVLRRIFPSDGPFKRVYSENDMKRAWRTRGGTPKVCDWVVDCGDVWLCLDATNRRIPQPLVNGRADTAQLDAELAITLAERKAGQIASTIRQLTQHLPRLTGRNLLRGTRFIPLVVTPDDGLPWNPAVHRRVQDLVAASGKLQGHRTTELGIVSMEDLGFLERIVDDGSNAGDCLRTWRSQRPEVSLQHFLHGQGVVLRRPQWELYKVGQLIDDLVDQQTTYVARNPLPSLSPPDMPS